MDNDFFHDQAVFALSDSQKLLYLFFLCEASKKNSSDVEIRLSYLSALLRSDAAKIYQDFETLKSLGLLNSESCNQVPADCRHDDVTQPASLPATKRDVRNETYECTEVEKTSTSGAIVEFLGDSEIEALLKPIEHTTQTRWIKLYPDPQWIRSEFLKAIGWIELNPRKAPKKKLARFLGSWLSRGWEQHRKSIPSNYPSSAINTTPISLEAT